MAVALFDLDRTLIDCNSAALWAYAEWRAGRITWRDGVWASYWLSRYGLGLSDGIEAAMEAAVQSVTGAEESDLDARIRTWFDLQIRHRLRRGAPDVLARHRAAGDRLVLATSGTWYAARAAADAYGLDDVVATRLEAVDGRLTGRIATMCLGPGKLRAVEAWADVQGVDLQDATFYTDSTSDLTLLERVAHPIVVNPDRALRRIALARRWPVVDWGLAPVGTPPPVVPGPI